jgi:hypothetical protein
MKTSSKSKKQQKKERERRAKEGRRISVKDFDDDEGMLDEENDYEKGKNEKKRTRKKGNKISNMSRKEAYRQVEEYSLPHSMLLKQSNKLSTSLHDIRSASSSGKNSSWPITYSSSFSSAWRGRQEPKPSAPQRYPRPKTASSEVCGREGKRKEREGREGEKMEGRREMLFLVFFLLV